MSSAPAPNAVLPGSGAAPEGHDLVLRSTRTVLPDGVAPATVVVQQGRIARLLPYSASGTGTGSPAGVSVLDLGDDALLPGLVDTHVHVNEPGRTEWEGFASATRAAALGGITTVVDMPLNSTPPTVDTEALAVKRQAAAEKAVVDVGFWGGAVPGNRAELIGLHRAGVLGFKAFLTDSGVPEFPPLSAEELDAVLREIRAFDGLLLVHAELGEHLAEPSESRRYQDFLRSRPPEAEDEAVRLLARLAERNGARVHVLHLSSAGAADIVRHARERGVRLTAETCPHYLALTAQEIPDGATWSKCCPPIREATNAEALWRALAEGVLDCVVSDHSPCDPALKTDRFDTAWGGIASLQLGLPVLWTAARARGFGLDDLARAMASGPADLVGLTDRGRIAVGQRADLVRLAPEETFTVDPAALAHRHPITAYAGRQLHGVVRQTWLRGGPV